MAESNMDDAQNVNTSSLHSVGKVSPLRPELFQVGGVSRHIFTKTDRYSFIPSS